MTFTTSRQTLDAAAWSCVHDHAVPTAITAVGVGLSVETVWQQMRIAISAQRRAQC